MNLTYVRTRTNNGLSLPSFLHLLIVAIHPSISFAEGAVIIVILTTKQLPSTPGMDRVTWTKKKKKKKGFAGLSKNEVFKPSREERIKQEFTYYNYTLKSTQKRVNQNTLLYVQCVSLEFARYRFVGLK